MLGGVYTWGTQSNYNICQKYKQIKKIIYDDIQNEPDTKLLNNVTKKKLKQE